MITAGGFAYAQARMQARHGLRPDAAAWEALAATAPYRGFLEQARATGLKPWLHNISAIAGARDIERLLRANLRARIAEVAGWLPRRWQAAVHWTAVLPDLPAIAHLLDGGEPRDWMREEDRLRPLALAEPAERAARLARAALAPLAGDGEAPADRWLAEWYGRLPATTWSERARIERLVRRVRAALVEAAAPASGIAPQLDRWLTLEFHRGSPGPVAVCCHLLLLALDFIRVRGALLERRLFVAEPAPGEPPS